MIRALSQATAMCCRSGSRPARSPPVFRRAICGCRPSMRSTCGGAGAQAQLALVNEATITQPDWAERRWNISHRPRFHDVILAEGAAAESYVDCDNRGMFHNAREFALLYPGDTPPRWEFCTRRMEEGSPELAAIRHGVLARARVFGRFTDDPDLRLVVDGTPIGPQLVANRRHYRFAVPSGGRSVVLASRSTVPVKVEFSAEDGRRLGVAVERILLRGAGLCVEIEPDCPALCNGFHDAEVNRGRRLDHRARPAARGPAYHTFGSAFGRRSNKLARNRIYLYGIETQAVAAGSVGRMSRAAG